jgi:hypothetical protein
MNDTLKLYELKRGDHFQVVFPDGTRSVVMTFDHVDGMYSVCFNADGSYAHVSAVALVERVPIGA